jgi:RNA polymerase sigma factor (TIGR02999 family)
MNASEEKAAARGQVTRLLASWRDGDAASRDQLMGLVYQHVHDLAASYLRQQRGDSAVTMRATELSHELFVRLLDDDTDWKDRRHFFGVVAVAMRRILVDAARARASEKRGGGLVRVTLSAAEEVPAQVPEAEALDNALRVLRGLDERTCEVIELTYLLGLKRDDIASTLAISVATVDRELRFGRAWLQRKLNP